MLIHVFVPAKIAILLYWQSKFIDQLVTSLLHFCIFFLYIVEFVLVVNEQ